MTLARKPVRITVSTHGGMQRNHKHVTFFVPDNMRVAVYAPPYCMLRDSSHKYGHHRLSDAHKIYEAGTRIPEMDLQLMHTKNDREVFAVQERISSSFKLHHYITANGQPLRTSHLPDLQRYQKYRHSQKNIVSRSVTLSQFLSMILQRYGESRFITVKVIACRSDEDNDFQVIFDPQTKTFQLNMKFWNDDNNDSKQKQVLKRLRNTENLENIRFANTIKRHLNTHGTYKNHIRRAYEDFDKSIDVFKKRRPS